MRSSIVDRPRKKAKPRTEPTVRYHSTTAPISETRSAARIVRQALAKPARRRVRSDSPGAHLVLQSFEVDDVRVDRDADRHDDAGDAGQREGEALVCAR